MSASEAEGNSSRIDGNAMLTIVTSRKAMKTATAVTSRTFQRRSSCFMQRTLHDRVASRYSLHHARTQLRRSELQRGQDARAGRRALDRADPARGLFRPPPL